MYMHSVYIIILLYTVGFIFKLRPFPGARGFVKIANSVGLCYRYLPSDCWHVCFLVYLVVIYFTNYIILANFITKKFSYYISYINLIGFQMLIFWKNRRKNNILTKYTCTVYIDDHFNIYKKIPCFYLWYNNISIYIYILYATNLFFAY